MTELSVVCAEPSPQLTSSVQVSAPGSVNEPRLKLWFAPSSEDWSAAAVTTGATLAIVTGWTSTDSVAESGSLSLSWILIWTLVLAGPSGKLHLKLPPEPSELSVTAPSRVPLAPQVG